MNIQSITYFITSFSQIFATDTSNFLRLLGINIQISSNILNLIGLFLSAIIAVFIATAVIVSYIKGAQFEPFFNSYEDDVFVRGRAGTIMGIVTVICSVWFLFAIVYIYFL